jgi:hypothetical protein
MTNRRKLRNPRPQNPVSAALSAIDGARIPGGCGQCNAYQTIRAHADGPDVHRITVHHDDWCPWYQSRKRGR